MYFFSITISKVDSQNKIFEIQLSTCRVQDTQYDKATVVNIMGKFVFALVDIAFLISIIKEHSFS